MSTSILPPPTRTGKSNLTPPRREQVLVVAHGDGFIQAFAEGHIDIRIVMMPMVDGSSHGEILAEEWLERSVPDCYRRIFWPGNVRATAMHERVRPSNIAVGETELALLRCLDPYINFTEEAVVWML